MSYKITDLIEKFIQIEQNGYEMYLQISEDESVTERIRTIARVFAKEELRHMEMLIRLKSDIPEEADSKVDVFIYDKAAKLIYEFIKNSKAINPADSRSMLQFCLNFENENLALIISVQGVLASEGGFWGTTLADILDKIVREEEEHARNIEAFL